MELGQRPPGVLAPSREGDRSAPPPGRRRPAVTGAVALTGVVVAVVLRFWTRSELWLDEALSVNIARLPLSELPGALRHDGAPPLYYALLHGWMRLFGDGNLAVRSLSGVLSVGSLPLMWLAGRRLGGSKVAWAALLLLASSPFAVHYATEARMYALVVMLTLVGYLALRASLEDPSPARLAGLAATVGLLLLSHYWAWYLWTAVGAGLVLRARRAEDGQPARRCLAALAAGAVLFVPWAPTFAYQLAHTGTPWAPAPTPAAVVATVDQFAGGAGPAGAGAWLAVLFLLLVALGVVGRPAGEGRVELDLTRPTPAAGLAGVAFGTLVLAVIASMVTGSAFAGRYAAVVLAPFVLVLAAGTAALGGERLRRGVVVVAVGLGLVGAAANVAADRTQAGEVAAAIERLAAPGDVVAYCPDQLGPSVSRLLPEGRFEQVTFPEEAPPARVDWVDYRRRSRARPPASFADALLARAGPGHDVFLVWSTLYRDVGRRCQRVAAALEATRPGVIRVRRDPDVFERMLVSQYPSP